jgi:hypothetical protein
VEVEVGVQILEELVVQEVIEIHIILRLQVVVDHLKQV